MLLRHRHTGLIVAAPSEAPYARESWEPASALGPVDAIAAASVVNGPKGRGLVRLVLPRPGERGAAIVDTWTLGSGPA